ncbi:MAG: glycosyltransferase family 39 protein [Verrucomicrobia bacterium]|nr:glycosyltransferase family 39 protein [Verrucomicrobiota bacterium]
MVGLTVTVRIRLLGVPLERDEGEYAYAGQLMLQGIPPYKLAYNMKFPGTYAAYAGIMALLGQNITAIHLGLLLINLATILVLFFLARRLVSTTAGVVAATTYSVLSLSPSVQGFAAHATHFAVLPLLLGSLLLIDAKGRCWRLFASGLLFGVALLMKQPAGWFVLFGALFCFLQDAQTRGGFKKSLLCNLIFDAGALLPFAITCLLLCFAGVFNKFWFWAVDYARVYGTMVSLPGAWASFKLMTPPVIGWSWAMWSIAGIGLLISVWQIRARLEAAFLVGFFLASAAAVCAGFYFRPHYFVFILPAIALLAGTAVARAQAARFKYSHVVPLVIAGAAITLPLVGEHRYFFEIAPPAVPRYIYGESPFPEAIRIGDYLRAHTAPGDTIAVLGSEPEVYFYSQRHSATGYIYTYGLMEPQKYARRMQDEMIHEIETKRPKYLVIVASDDSWKRRRNSDLSIFNWANEYSRDNYTAVGLINIIDSNRTDYFFDDVPASVSSLRDYILVYQRKS